MANAGNVEFLSPTGRKNPVGGRGTPRQVTPSGAEHMTNPNQSLIDSEWKFVICISGGGQEIIGELTRHGSMSSRLLEAIVPYSIPSFYKFVGGPVDHIVSPETARAAAMVCYQRARQYAPGEKVYGFASTGAVVKVGGEREGRKHKVCMAIQDGDRTIGINLEYRPGRTRQEEETLTARCIKQALLWGSHIFGDVSKQIEADDRLWVESKIADPSIRDLVNGKVNRTKTYNNNASKAVFSSSCNPLHSGHVNIMHDASKRLNCKIDIELCIANADKPPLDYLTIDRRILDVCINFKPDDAIGDIVLTNKPLFFDKVDLFPGAVFVVGMDTYNRILNPRYYTKGMVDILNGLDRMQEKGNRFLVYPRKGVEPSISGHEYTIGAFGYDDLVEIVSPYDGYEVSDISSTAIRRMCDAES